VAEKNTQNNHESLQFVQICFDEEKLKFKSTTLKLDPINRAIQALIACLSYTTS